MENKKLILLIGLGALAVLSLLYGILTPSKVKRELVSQPALSAKEAAKPLPLMAPAKRLSGKSQYPSWGRNPFLPKEIQAPAVGKLILVGIAWDQTSPRAVINDRIVEEGDQLAGMRVVEIKKDRVILHDGVTPVELRLGRRK